jgi:AraC-like DNA-binding protein
MTASPARVAPRCRALPEVSVRSLDVDEAREVGSRVYHRHRVTVLGDTARFAMTLDATTLGPLTIGWLTYDTAVRLESTHAGHYQVNIATEGRMLATSGGREVVAGPGVATVYRPDQPAAFSGWDVPAPVLAVRIARRALDHELEQLLDRPLRRPPELALDMDVATGRGAQWLALVHSLAGDLASDSALIRQPMVAAPFAHAVMSGLLLAARHEYRDALVAPSAVVGSPTVRAAQAFIEANADQPLTVVDIARAAGVGVRGLQQGFQRALEMSPMQYLRQVRLRQVHRELRAADPATTTVGQVAARWGFRHQGRFAAEYRRRYGVAPADTLRSR